MCNSTNRWSDLFFLAGMLDKQKGTTPEGLEAPKRKPIESKPLSDGLRAFLSSDTANDMKSDAVRLRESLFNVFERFLRLAEFA